MDVWHGVGDLSGKKFSFSPTLGRRA